MQRHVDISSSGKNFFVKSLIITDITISVERQNLLYRPLHFQSQEKRAPKTSGEEKIKKIHTCFYSKINSSILANF